MAGFTRRPKPLKAKTDLADLLGVAIANPSTGDLIVYNSVTGDWENTKSLTGTYLLTGELSATTLTASGVITGGTLAISGSALIGSLTVTGVLAAGATTLASLTVSGNASVAGTLTITGTLAFAGFSASGNGSIGGNLTVGGTLAVTGATTLASTLSAGATTLASAVVTGNELIGGNLAVVGNISGATVAGGTVSAASTLYVGVSAIIAGATYTGNDITFLDDGTAIQLYNGTLLSLSLDSASIIEGTGNPTNALAYTAGSLYLRTDGDRDQTLWVRGPGAWFPVKDTRDDLDFLLTDWAERQEYIQTGSLAVGDLTAGSIIAQTIAAPTLPFYLRAGGFPIYDAVMNANPLIGLQTSMYGSESDGTSVTGRMVPKFKTVAWGARYLGRLATNGGSDDVLLEFYDSTETTRFGSLWFKHSAAFTQFQIQSQIDDAVFTVLGATGGVAAKALFYASPSAETRLYYNATEVWRTASNGFRGGVSATGVGILYGAGTPEAAVTAPVGSIFLRTDGGALTSFYVKETGVGNTGWVGK